MTQSQSPYSNPYASAPPPPSTNGLGLAGFIVSIVGMVVCLGTICPIGLILSFAAVFRRPRGFAIAGLIIGVVGTLLWALLWWLFIASVNNSLSFTNFYRAQSDIDSHYFSYNSLPDDATGGQIVGWYDDQWGTAFTYHLVDSQNYEIISAGPDMQFGTTDDVTHPLVAPTYYGGLNGSSISSDESFADARETIERAYGEDYQSPAWHEIERLLNDRFIDEWGTPLRYDAGERNTYELRSAGPDTAMDTDDDIVRSYTLGEEDADAEPADEPGTEPDEVGPSQDNGSADGP